MLKQLLATSLAAVAIACLAGCKSVTLETGDTNLGAYNYGEFQGLHNINSSAAVTQAVQEALKQFGLTEVAITQQQFSTDIVAKDAKDLKIQIWVQEYNSKQTLLRIRWGSGGDLPKSREFYYAVEGILTGAPVTRVIHPETSAQPADDFADTRPVSRRR